MTCGFFTRKLVGWLMIMTLTGRTGALRVRTTDVACPQEMKPLQEPIRVVIRGDALGQISLSPPPEIPALSHPSSLTLCFE